MDYGTVAERVPVLNPALLLCWDSFILFIYSQPRRDEVGGTQVLTTKCLSLVYLNPKQQHQTNNCTHHTFTAICAYPIVTLHSRRLICTSCLMTHSLLTSPLDVGQEKASISSLPLPFFLSGCCSFHGSLYHSVRLCYHVVFFACHLWLQELHLSSCSGEFLFLSVVIVFVG